MQYNTDIINITQKEENVREIGHNIARYNVSLINAVLQKTIIES